jgi:hypothetical protein
MATRCLGRRRQEPREGQIVKYPTNDGNSFHARQDADGVIFGGVMKR